MPGDTVITFGGTVPPPDDTSHTYRPVGAARTRESGHHVGTSNKVLPDPGPQLVSEPSTDGARPDW
jgi:hypothetical protein